MYSVNNRCTVQISAGQQNDGVLSGLIRPVWGGKDEITLPFNSHGLEAPGNAADLVHRSQLIKRALWLLFAVGGRLLWKRRQRTSKELWLYCCRGQGSPALWSTSC